MKTKFFAYFLVLTATVGLSHSLSYAAAFSSEAYSVSAMGNAYAGSVTGTHDNADMFFNPAALSQFKQIQMTVGGIYSHLAIDTNVQSSTFNGTSFSGSHESSPGESTLFPTFAFSFPVGNRGVMGINVTSPEDLNTNYPADSLARFHGLHSRIRTLNINPMMAYQLTDKISAGVGLQYQRINIELSRNIANTSGANVYGNYTGNDSAYGFNLGLLVQPTETFKLGLGYRSAIKHKTDGSVDLLINGSPSGYRGIVDFPMPDILSLGAAYQATPKIELVSDLRWTRWSRISKFLIERVSPPPGNKNIAVLLPLRNSLLASIGLNYNFNKNWLLRSGIAYERDAVTDDYRNPRFPVGNRQWISLGGRYKINEYTYLHLSYVHQFIKNTTSHIPETVSTATASLDASYKQSVNAIGMGLSVNW